MPKMQFCLDMYQLRLPDPHDGQLLSMHTGQEIYLRRPIDYALPDEDPVPFAQVIHCFCAFPPLALHISRVSLEIYLSG